MVGAAVPGSHQDRSTGRSPAQDEGPFPVPLANFRNLCYPAC